MWADLVSLYTSYLLNVDPVELKRIPKIRESVTSSTRGAR
jgi:glucose/mannose-6-phosphate isomerase